MHFSVVDMDGYRSRREGDRVVFVVGNSVVDDYEYVASYARVSNLPSGSG